MNPLFGQIVLVDALLDPQERNPKIRPAVVISAPVEDDLDQTFEVMAITTFVPTPLPDDHVLLPWQQPRHPKTGLSKRDAAVGIWIKTISPDRVIRPIGFVPGREWLQIVELLRRLRGEVGLEADL